MTIDQAVVIMRNGRSTHFDPVLLDYFLNDLHDAQAEPPPTPVG
jgi:HD-GYP domain-containing protein (c-di-GMP phosphodiesterase class II)